VDYSDLVFHKPFPLARAIPKAPSRGTEPDPSRGVAACRTPGSVDFPLDDMSATQTPAASRLSSAPLLCTAPAP